MRRRRGIIGPGAFLVGLAFVGLLGQAACPAFESAFEAGRVDDDRISEASGLAAGRLNTGILWVHNDSGDRARLYAMDLEGRMHSVWRFPGIQAVDCEDLAIGPRPGRKGPHLFLGDIGDNGRRRDSIRIYIATEPSLEELSGSEEHALGPVEIIEAAYPDGAHDAETLLVDPLTGDLYIVCKAFRRSPVYRIPAGPRDGGPVIMEPVAEIPWGLATGGDVSADGTEILVRGYWNVSLWRRSPYDPLWMAFLGIECRLPYAIEPQGEAIAFTSSADAYLTLSEGFGAAVYRFARRTAPDGG